MERELWCERGVEMTQLRSKLSVSPISGPSPRAESVFTEITSLSASFFKSFLPFNWRVTIFKKLSHIVWKIKANIILCIRPTKQRGDCLLEVEILGELWNVMLENNGEDKMARGSNNEQVLERVRETMTLLNIILRRKANWIGHILRRNCLLHEGQMT